MREREELPGEALLNRYLVAAEQEPRRPRRADHWRRRPNTAIGRPLRPTAAYPRRHAGGTGKCGGRRASRRLSGAHLESELQSAANHKTGVVRSERWAFVASASVAFWLGHASRESWLHDESKAE